jgi:EmrB/QacA subfamily drug resistance transporter
VAGISMALGPLIGGALTQSIGWRSVFWINLPIAAAAIVLAALHIPESKAARARRIDPVGQLLVITALACLIYAVIEGRRMHWASPAVVGLFAMSLSAVVALLLYEPRRNDPLLDLRFFRSVPFSSAAVIAVCSFSIFAGFLFLNSLYLQEVRGLSSFRTGLYTLPLALATMICSPLSGRMVGAYGTRPSLLAAGTAMVLSALMLTHLSVGSGLAALLLSYVIFGIGFGLVNAPITNTAVSGMPKAQAGLAAAVASTSRQVGASLGVAVAGTVVGTAAGAGFAEATHAFWWIMVGAGILVFILGLVSNSAWARRSSRQAAHLLEDPAPAESARQSAVVRLAE